MPFTAEQETRLLTAIRNGIYAHVAARLAGVPAHQFEAWMRRGRRRRRGRCHALWLRVEQASAEARARAEQEVRQADVRFWLRHGPGKDELPGWARPDRQASARAQSLLARREFNRLVAWLLKVLEPFPEARRAIRQALRSQSRVGAPGAGSRSPGNRGQADAGGGSA